jgi:exopolysaccharide biosynthesis polyprenyl glycosylphosphotransferase
MNKRLQVFKYVIADLLAATLSWTLFFRYRKLYLEPIKFGKSVPLKFDENFYYGLLTIPLFWLFLYLISGHYNEIYRRYRLRELSQTLIVSIIGVLVLFFAIILDDQVAGYKYYYHSIVALFGFHFGATFLVRIILTSNTVKKIHTKKIGFNTAVIGGNQQALSMYDELQSIKNYPGFNFVGFVSVNGKDTLLEKHMPYLGKFNSIREHIQKLKIEEVIIAIESADHKDIGNIINELEGSNVKIKIIPDMYDILSGSVRMTSIFGATLTEINPEIMPAWQFSLKRIFDILISLFVVIILSPVFIIIGLLVKFSSKGVIIFKQERIGIHGKPFFIYKFRSMFIDAENSGPQLSSSTDGRITPIGRVLRKTRLDEFPQFFNVLKGEMSLVGPRPERQFYIDQILKCAAHYRHLHKVRPGITSWGQVKYGYAENVDQMVQRLKYDILYIENMSLAVDIKILAYTILTVIKVSGK